MKYVHVNPEEAVQIHVDIRYTSLGGNETCRLQLVTRRFGFLVRVLRVEIKLPLHSSPNYRSKKSFGIHWGTFPLTYTPYLEPRNRTIEALRGKNIQLRDFLVPEMGDTVVGAA